MGCVQAKPSTNSPPRGLERLKSEHGYVKGGYVRPRRSTGQRNLSGDLARFVRSASRKESDSIGSSGNVSVGDKIGKEKKVVAKEGEKDGNGSIDGGNVSRRINSGSSGAGNESRRINSGSSGAGNVSRRTSSTKITGEDELVDGWPKWLTDNIPKHVFAGLVPRSADSYDKLDKVGQGTYSNVYKARDRKTGKIVALKKVRFDTSEPESVKFMAREIMILQKLDHPNIVKLEGLATSRMQYSLYLVFEFMPTDLSRIISRSGERLTEPQVKCYMEQLLSGLQHCHERGILHRDIKGSNLLIDKNGMLKIADFGLANYFNPEKKHPLTSRVVTLWYRAPELLLGATEYGIGIDLWSAGCLMAEMFTGSPIMPGRTEVEQLHRIFKLCGTPSDECWKKLKVSTTFRPPHSYKSRLKEAFREFPASSLGLFNILLSLDPTYRGSAASALQNQFFLTSPLACDISGLPIVFKEEDEPIIINERKKSRTKRRSQSKRERIKKIVDGEKQIRDSGTSNNDEKEKGEESIILSQEPGSETTTTTSASSSTKRTIKEEIISPPLLSQIIRNNHQINSPSSESHPNAITNIKNQPPLPFSKRTTNNNYNPGKDYKNYRLNHVQRSISTREFRHLD